MDKQNFAFLCYGMIAAWTVLMIYVLALATRERRIRQQMDDLRRLVEKDAPSTIKR
jgi:hypothetical protein